MKKLVIVLMLTMTLLILTGCDSKEKEKNNNSNISARLQKVTGNIVKANVDKNGNIIIKKSDITNNATYISYEYEGVTTGSLAVKDSSGNVKVVVNTCQSCGGSPYAYFVQVGNQIQCQNCGNMFNIDELDNLVENGCNPIAVIDKKTKNGIITIGAKQLKELKTKFENWEGQKA